MLKNHSHSHNGSDFNILLDSDIYQIKEENWEEIDFQ